MTQKNLPVKLGTMAAGLPTIKPGTLGRKVALTRDGGGSRQQIVGLCEPLVRGHQYLAAAGLDREV